MNFHGLARKELQALCKKNKIPANITNVAMADALSALPHVEGIEEMMQLQSPEKVGINSSKTGLTSTRGTKTVTKEPESSQPVSRSRLGTRRRRITEDPEADESKKEDLQTPAVRKRAPVAASSRRKKVEESSVQRVYSTRRSVRLAEQMAGLSLDEGVEKSEAGKIDCDLSKDNFVNCDKESDIGSEKKAVTEEALNEKVDMQGVADITTAGDDENEPDIQDNVAVVNGEPDVTPNMEVKHECKVEDDEAKVETKQDVGCEAKVEREVEESNEEAKAETKQDVGCEELLEVNVLTREDNEEAIVVTGESEKTKGSDLSPVTTVFSDALISDSNRTHSDALLESVASLSPTEFMADNLNGNSAKLEYELSAKQDFDAMEPELPVEEEKPNSLEDGENSYQGLRVGSDELEFPKEGSKQAFEDHHVMEPEFAVEEDKSIDVAAVGENSFQQPSGSLDELEFTNEESEPAVEDFHTMELESVTVEKKSTGIEDAKNSFRNQMASIDPQESGEEETGVHCIKGVVDSDSDGSVIASDDDSVDTTEDDSSNAEESDGSVTASDVDSCETTKVDPSNAEACDKITAPETEADAESSLAIKEKAASPIKQQIMASETHNLVSGVSETQEKLATEADVESSVISEESSPLEKESTVIEQVKMKMELKSNDDKENFAAYDEKKMKMEVKEQKNTPYGNLSLRQLSKMLKAFHLENNDKKKDDHHQKNVAAIKDQVAKTPRTALQALPENQMTTEKEN